MKSMKALLRVGICIVFLISLLYGLPACEKKEKSEPAAEKTQEMMEGGETGGLEVEETVGEAKEKVEELAEEAGEEAQEVIEEGKETVGEMQGTMERSPAGMGGTEESQAKE